ARAEQYAGAALAEAGDDARARLWRAGMRRRCECALQLAVRLWVPQADSPLVEMASRNFLMDPQRRSAFAEALDSDWPGPGGARSRLLAILENQCAANALPVGIIAELDERLAILKPRKEETMPTSTAEASPDAAVLLNRVLTLADVPLFANLEGEELALIAEAVEPVEVAAGQQLIRQGDAGDSLFVIVEGAVDVVVGGRCVASLSAGAVVGEMAVIDGQPRSADVIASDEGRVRLLRLWKEDFDLLLEAWPQIGRGVMQVLSVRLRNASRAAG
ncbi:MAG: cyclic nucleotide-binding domain-containing protein, partial [Candidatus Dadabacteria bacterium]